VSDGSENLSVRKAGVWFRLSFIKRKRRSDSGGFSRRGLVREFLNSELNLEFYVGEVLVGAEMPRASEIGISFRIDGSGGGDSARVRLSLSWKCKKLWFPRTMRFAGELSPRANEISSTSEPASLCSPSGLVFAQSSREKEKVRERERENVSLSIFGEDTPIACSSSIQRLSISRDNIVVDNLSHANYSSCTYSRLNLNGTRDAASARWESRDDKKRSGNRVTTAVCFKIITSYMGLTSWQIVANGNLVYRINLNGLT